MIPDKPEHNPSDNEKPSDGRDRERPVISPAEPDEDLVCDGITARYRSKAELAKQKEQSARGLWAMQEIYVRSLVRQVLFGIDEPQVPPPEIPLTPAEIDEIIERGPGRLKTKQWEILLSDPAALGLIRMAVLKRYPEAWISLLAAEMAPPKT